MSASAQEGQIQVDSVDVTGYKRIDKAAIIQQLKVKSGIVSRDQITAEVKSLYATGFFDQVTAKVVSMGNGSSLLRYDLTEKPLVRKVFVKGNKEVSEDDLAGVIKIDGHRFLDKTRIDTLKQRIVSYYQLQGMYDVEIDHQVTPIAENQVDITFQVREGKKYRVRDVHVRGLKELDEDDVKKELQTKTYKWWSSWLFGTGKVNEEMLEADKQVLRQYLLDNGFVEGTVGDASIEKKEDSLAVYFDVSEGPQYKIGKIKVEGDLIENSQEKTIEDVESTPGDIFSASKVRSDIFHITDKFSDIGYAFANVVPNTELDKEKELVDLVFKVTKGNLVRINRINITGNDKTYDHVIRRNFKIGEKSLYSGKKIKRSQTVLERLGYFEEVSIVNEPTGDPSLVDLNVNVREGSTGSFSAGAGYATGGGLLFNTRLSENNLFGGGQRMNVNLDFGTIQNNQSISIDDPKFLDTDLAVGADYLRTRRQFIDFTRQLSGGSLSFGYPGEVLLGEWAEDVNFNVRYDYTNIDISDVEATASQFVKDSVGTSTASSIIPSIVRNTLNNPMNPSKGSRQTISYEQAGLGGNQDYYLFEFRNSWYYPILQTSFGNFIISDRTQFGYGQSNNDNPFPLFRRYFPGGINSIRGFRAFSLGPVDANNSKFGGSKQLINNLELIFPIAQSAGLQGVIFYDIGNAFDDDQSIRVGDLRRSYGAGIRWNSPLGPIRIEFGYPADRKTGERKMVPMFSFGAPI